ncbi:MAG: helix-turn-helix domain-containing protein [Planctomycetota bacterium]|nr:helix-turn-helix domain-containing protein [Planctomycetota bacterium]
MPNIAAVLREEIQRLARKEVRAATLPMKKHRAEDRSAIAALKRKVAALEREIAFLRKQEKKRIEEEPAAKEAEGVRFSPKWIAADRRRLGISAKDYGALVGVSMLTIYNWEKGKSKPRAKQLAAWANVRGIGKREAMKRLEIVNG